MKKSLALLTIDLLLACVMAQMFLKIAWYENELTNIVREEQ